MYDIAGFVNRYFDDAALANSGDEIRVNCPCCEDNKQHLYINTTKQVCYCFKCDYSASWINLVMRVTGYDYWRALGELYSKPRMVDFQKTFGGASQVKLAKTVCLPDGFVNLLHATGKSSNVGFAYIQKRGFTYRHAEYYNIGVADSVPHRIIIPIEGEYWQGRSLYGWLEPKYINPKVDARDVIFNSQALDMFDEIVICEGAFSAMAVGENAIALIGKHCTEEKFERLSKAKTQSYILAVEPEAHKEMAELADKLSKEGKTIMMWYYGNGDPAENDSKIECKEWNFKSKVEAKLNDRANV